MGWNWFDMHTIKLNTLCPSNATNTYVNIAWKESQYNSHVKNRHGQFGMYAPSCVLSSLSLFLALSLSLSLIHSLFSHNCPANKMQSISFESAQWSSILIHVYHISILNINPFGIVSIHPCPRSPLNAVEFIITYINTDKRYNYSMQYRYFFFLSSKCTFYFLCI